MASFQDLSEMLFRQKCLKRVDQWQSRATIQQGSLHYFCLLPFAFCLPATGGLAFCLLPYSLLRAGAKFFIELFDERKFARCFFIAAQPAESDAELVMGIRAVRQQRDGLLQRVDR